MAGVRSPSAVAALLGRVQLVQVLVAARLNQWANDRFLGFWWWLLEPLAMTCTYLVMVQIAFRANTSCSTLFLMCAVLPWSWFAAATAAGLESLTTNKALIRTFRVTYVLFPTAEVIAATIRFLAAFVIFFLLMAFYGIAPTAELLWLPLLLVVQFAFTLGVAYWLAWAQVFVEDARNVWRVVTRVWFFLSPSIYALDQVPERLRFWFRLNPFSAFFTSYRNVLIQGESPDGMSLWLACVVAAVLLASGARLLRHIEGVAPLYL